ncbi:MAG: futalosine hydrolase [Planctomycetaceae bacterium]
MTTLLLVPTALERDLLLPQPDWRHRRDVVTELCGFGLVASGILAASRIADHRPDSVVLAGIAGALSPEMTVGRAYCFDRVAVYGIGAGSGPDFQTSTQMGWPQVADVTSEPVGDILSLHTDSPDHRSGLLLSVCAASASVAEANAKRQTFPDAVAEDMEGFAVALACRVAGVPCQIIRGISNNAGDRDRSNWKIPGLLPQWRRVTGDNRHESTIRLAISTCPNDTFAFHALMNGNVDCRGLDFQVELLDIQELNNRLLADRVDVAKTSFHAALLLAEHWVVLPSGSALGFGVGPLLLASHPDTVPATGDQVTLCPGEHTTAALLFQLFYPETSQIRQAVFSDIMPQLQQRRADFGVCIHEGRFTWQDQGLALVEDLGTRWEQETGSPLPLGGIVASRRLSAQTAATVQAVIFDSLQYALAHRDAPLTTMRKYAQEFSDDVLMQHVDLYVNQWTVNLGEVGKHALNELSVRAARIGLLPPGGRPLEVLTV